MNKKIEKLYENLQLLTRKFVFHLKPHLRMLLRFFALPYCYFFLVNWEECKRSKIKVCGDIIYIFFVLKYYPYNYSLCRLWEKDRSNWHYYYGSIYEPYAKSKLSKKVQPEMYKVIFHDKEVCNQICQSLNLPLPIQPGVLDPDLDYISDLKRLLESYENEWLIIKPVRGAGGREILLAHKQNDGYKINDGENSYGLESLKIEHRSVVQVCIHQHPLLVFSTNSLNTIRIVTLLTKHNSVLILGAYIRFGQNSSYVDNVSSGGISVGINTYNGTLLDTAHDFDSNVYRKFPETDAHFAGYMLPFWDDIINLAKRIQSYFPYYRLLGLDIGISENGPLLVEINPSPDTISLEQRCGPLLKDPDIMQAFHEYDLLF